MKWGIRLLPGFRGLPLERKLVLLVAVTTIIVLSTSFGIYGVIEYRTKSQALTDTAVALTRVVSINSTAALAFRDPDTGAEILGALQGEPLIVAAQLYREDGQFFAEFTNSDPRNKALLSLIQKRPPRLFPDGDITPKNLQREVTETVTVNGRDFIDIARPIVSAGRPVGFINVQASLESLRTGVIRQLIIASSLLAISLLATLLLANWLQRLISVPILRLANAIRSVSEDQDYSLRVAKDDTDELGDLIDGFNDMLTQIQNRDRALKIAHDEAQSANQMKSQFLANMSHEIRTPMNGVLGMTDLLSGTRLEERQRHYVKTIHQSGKALLNVINDILDFSKIEAGHLKLEPTDFNLRNVLTDTFELVADQAFGKGLELLWQLDDDVPLSLRGDTGRLRQVLLNLLGNAIKFTLGGEIILRVSVLADIEKQAKLQFALSDTGIGIKEEKLDRIFEAFSQADESTTRRFGGTGLGLSISSQLVNMMGGEMSVKSRVGVGSTFTFTITLAKQSTQNPSLTNHPDVELQGQRILVVDDNATNREILGQQLATWGVEADEAADGFEALEMLRVASAGDKGYSMAILDLVMPMMDGFELATAINADPLISGTPVIMLTSGSHTIALADANAVGVICVLRKPVIVAELYHCLKRSLSEDTVKTGGPTIKNLGVDALPQVNAHVLIAEDNPVNQVVARDMLSLFGCTSDIVSDGEQAVDAIRKNNYALVLMDIQMPVMDGCDATRAIRGGSKDADIPIVALTANAMEGDRERFLDAGMDDYLSKPFDRQALSDILSKWVDTSNPQHQALPSSEQKNEAESGRAQPHQQVDNNGSPASANDLTTVFDQKVIDRLRATYGDKFDGKLQQLSKLYKTAAEKTLDELRSGVENLDAVLIARAAHSLKSSSGNLGATQLVEICRRLEEKARTGTLIDIDNDLRGIEHHYRQVIAALPA